MEKKNASNATLAEVSSFIQTFRSARGWEKYNDPYDLAAAINAEAAELLQLLLWKKNENVPALIAQEPLLKTKLAEEMADIFAFLLTLSKAIDVDLIEVFFAKMQKNADKYPIRQNEISPPRKRWLE